MAKSESSIWSMSTFHRSHKKGRRYSGDLRRENERHFGELGLDELADMYDNTLKKYVVFASILISGKSR